MIKITIENVDGPDLEMSVEDARKLYQGLKELFEPVLYASSTWIPNSTHQYAKVHTTNDKYYNDSPLPGEKTTYGVLGGCGTVNLGAVK